MGEVKGTFKDSFTNASRGRMRRKERQRDQTTELAAFVLPAASLFPSAASSIPKHLSRARQAVVWWGGGGTVQSQGASVFLGLGFSTCKAKS